MPDPATQDALPAASPPATTYLSGIVTAGLAAICGAIFTSWAGVQGTLVGAMIGATIGSSVSEVVRAPLDGLERRLVAAGFSARRLRQDGVVKTVVTSPTAAQQAFRMISRGAVVTVGATAIVGFLLALGGMTAVEAAAGEPLAAIVSDSPATGTTLGNAIAEAPSVRPPAPDAQSGPAGGQNDGNSTSSRPADPILGAEDPARVAPSSPTPTSTDANDKQNQNASVAASPVASPSPDASPAPDRLPTGAVPIGDATATASPAIAATPSASVVPGGTGSPAAVPVVTVVATATPTPHVNAQAANARAPVAIQTSTPTQTPTPTLTATATTTSATGAVPALPRSAP